MYLSLLLEMLVHHRINSTTPGFVRFLYILVHQYPCIQGQIQGEG